LRFVRGAGRLALFGKRIPDRYDCLIATLTATARSGDTLRVAIEFPILPIEKQEIL